ncbi:hypothetical protein Tco_0223990 [Tanacetum coccineum]
MGCCLTSWFSKKQTTLTISTTKAEYFSAEIYCQQAFWMKQALVDYDIKLDDISVLCDNKGAIDLRNILIEKVSSEENIADILTNPLKREPFNLLRLATLSQTSLHPSFSSIFTNHTMPKTNKDKKSAIEFKCTARISVCACFFVNPCPVSPPYQNLSPPTDHQTGPPPSPIMSPPLLSIVSLGISPEELLITSKSTPLPMTSQPPAPSQPSKHSSALAINLDPIELIFYTPPTSPYLFFDSFEDLPQQTTTSKTII